MQGAMPYSAKARLLFSGSGVRLAGFKRGSA
ncbi:hypothetical protein Q673_16135 [Marinobacter sp. EN3]|nr:hypothetical protein Q673_16135 [Marinobacter sp. EN3]